MSRAGKTYAPALDADARRWLADRLGASAVRFDEPMSRHTWMKVGGPAEALVAPERVEDLPAILVWAKKAGTPLLVLGGGTNLVVTDAGVPGVVLTLSRCLNRLAVTGTEGDKTVVTAMAGAKLPALCRMAVERGLGGMNFAIGIPGTVGGAVAMNAGTADGAMESVVSEVTMLHGDGRIAVARASTVSFGYRRFSPGGESGNGETQSGTIVLGVNVTLTPANADRLAVDAAARLHARQKSQPLHEASAGCFFRNPPEGRPAGRLIDEAGLKGRRIGDAQVSHRHANFIVNRGRATAEDVLALAALVEDTVERKFGVLLKREVKIVGI